MKEYKIARIKGIAPDWPNIHSLNIDSYILVPDPGISAKAQICYDNDALYVRLTAKEKNILKRYTGLLDPVANDSCLEFFFCPIWGDDRYFNFEFNPLGAMYIGFGHGMHDLVRQVPQNGKSLFGVVTFDVPDGWGISFRIPYSFIRMYFPAFAPKSGVKIRANCQKCGDETEQPHYISWNPITNKTPTFHWPKDYGCMIFE